ncbi:MAG: enoyl-CoA hydratase-related protein [Gemmataceae bacterium]
MAAISERVLESGVRVWTIDQPGSRANVLTTDLWAELGEKLAVVGPGPGLVITSAKPGIFIAGADLKLLEAAPAPNDPAVQDFLAAGQTVLFGLENLPCPTVAVMDGAAMGGGLEVALACDYRVVGTHPKLQLALPEVKLGLIPGWGGTQRLPRLIGVRAALDALRTGDAIPPTLLAEQTDSENLLNHAEECLSRPHWLSRRQQKQRKPAELCALAECHDVFGRVVYAGCDLPLAEAIAAETTFFHQLAGSPESKAKIAAFFAARGKS